jgi:transcriptional regulator with XRE-family HTH domain
MTDTAIAVTSSHFCSAERQYRFPLEYGGQRPPTAQWTATASGAILFKNTGVGPKIKMATIGTIEDLGIKDANNMGAAMAPAVAATIQAFFKDTGTDAYNYDKIFTGDLGFVGSKLLYEILESDGIDIKTKHDDCGLILYDREKQDVHAGASGCGCSASVLCTHIIKNLREKNNWTQKDLAERMFKAESTIGMWEQGRREPDYDSLIELARLFDVPVDYLIGNNPLDKAINKVKETDQYDINENLSDEQIEQNIKDLLKNTIVKYKGRTVSEKELQAMAKTAIQILSIHEGDK